MELLAEMLILSEYWTPKTVVSNPSEFNIHRKVESTPKAINIPSLKNLKFEIAGAGSLNIRTCKNYWQLFTANFEPKFLLNFLDIWKKNYKKRTNWFGQNGKIIKITQVSRKISVQKRKKKVKGKCTCCFGSKFILYLVPILYQF